MIKMDSKKFWKKSSKKKRKEKDTLNIWLIRRDGKFSPFKRVVGTKCMENFYLKFHNNIVYPTFNDIDLLPMLYKFGYVDSI